MKKSIFYGLSIGVVGCLLAATGYADNITKPHTFTDGTPAVAGDVNANFDTVYEQVNKVGGVINIDDVTHTIEVGSVVQDTNLVVNGRIIPKKDYAYGGVPYDVEIDQEYVLSNRTIAFDKMMTNTNLIIKYEDTVMSYNNIMQLTVFIDGQVCVGKNRFIINEDGDNSHMKHNQVSSTSICTGIGKGAHMIEIRAHLSWASEMINVELYGPWSLEVEETN